MNTYKILIVEDDRGLNRGIALALKEETVEFLSALTLGTGTGDLEKQCS